MASITDVNQIVIDALDAAFANPQVAGPISLSLRNDSEDNAYKHQGRIDFWNVLVNLNEESRLCETIRQTWSVELVRYYEAKANENPTLTIATDTDTLLSTIKSSPPSAWLSTFDYFHVNLVGQATITQIGNTRVYTQSIFLSAISYR